MKTRDELAEMFAVATAQEYASTDGQPDDLARWAFACADAFVAERERRAVHPGDATEQKPHEGSVCGVDQCCANPPTHRDRNDRTAWLSGPCCGSPACCTLGGSEGDGWSRAPLDGAPANERPPSNPPKHYADAAWEWAHIHATLRRAGRPLPIPGDPASGALVATAIIGEPVTASDSPWWIGPIGWPLIDVRRLPEPIPCKGRLGLWTLPEGLVLP